MPAHPAHNQADHAGGGPETSQPIQVCTEFTPQGVAGARPLDQPAHLAHNQQIMQEVGQGPVSISRYGQSSLPWWRWYPPIDQPAHQLITRQIMQEVGQKPVSISRYGLTRKHLHR